MASWVGLWGGGKIREATGGLAGQGYRGLARQGYRGASWARLQGVSNTSKRRGVTAFQGQVTSVLAEARKANCYQGTRGV